MSRRVRGEIAEHDVRPAPLFRQPPGDARLVRLQVAHQQSHVSRRPPDQLRRGVGAGEPGAAHLDPQEPQEFRLAAVADDPHPATQPPQFGHRRLGVPAHGVIGRRVAGADHRRLSGKPAAQDIGRIGQPRPVVVGDERGAPVGQHIQRSRQSQPGPAGSEVLLEGVGESQVTTLDGQGVGGGQVVMARTGTGRDEQVQLRLRSGQAVHHRVQQGGRDHHPRPRRLLRRCGERPAAAGRSQRQQEDGRHPPACRPDDP